MTRFHTIRALLAFFLVCLSAAGIGKSTAAVQASQEGVVTEVSAPSYPRTIEMDAGSVIVHMPQIVSWDQYQTMTARVAIEVRPANHDHSFLGSIRFSASTDIDFDERLVVVHDIEVLELKIADQEQIPEDVKALARDAIPLNARSVPLDVLVRALPEDFESPNYRPGPATEVSFEPPRIFYSTTPATLMIIDGEPLKAPINESSIEFVVNTNWDLFWDTKKERWYVLNGVAWQWTDSLSNAKWKTTTRLPKDLKNLPEEENWDEVRKALPAKKPKDAPPLIMVSTDPAELILIDGEPRLETIAEAGLTWVSNTDSDLFFYQGEYYYLITGRWFLSAELNEGWAPVVALPDNFLHIPTDHQKSHVLASVPGSDDARAAAIEAQIPRTATIQLGEAPEIEVTYAGEPQFVAIEGTAMERAANTSYQVIKVGHQYYLCYNAVWFLANAAKGPWAVATQVPEAIYTIPASDPAHNVTYVYAYPQTSTTTVSSSTVTYGYTPGYTGVFLVAGAIVYGSGHYHSPYYYYGPSGYPAYWHYPHSYGHGAWYNPSTGTYGQRAVAYGPYGGAAATAAYNPRTGTYARGYTVWDNDEMARSAGAYNPRTGSWGGGNMYYDFDDKEGWSERVVGQGDRWVYSETEYDSNRARSEYETAKGITGVSNRERNDDVITGSGTIEGGNRSGTTSSRIDNEGYQANIVGSQGGSVDISKEWRESGRDVEITNPDGMTLSGTTTRDGQGNARTEFDTSGGGQGTTVRTDQGRTTVGKSDSGDLYASHDGEIYKRGDDGGWSQYQNGGWQSSQGSRNSTYSASAQSRNYNSLDRQYQARQTGTKNYNQYQSQRGSIGRGGSAGRRGGGRR